MLLYSNVTSCPIPRLSGRAPVGGTGGPGVSGLTRATRMNLYGAITSNLGPNDSITGLSILNCSPGVCCSNHSPLRTNSVNVSVGRASMSFHYGLIALASRRDCTSGAVISCYTNSVSARRTGVLVSCLTRRFGDRRFTLCTNMDCHRYLV